MWQVHHVHRLQPTQADAIHQIWICLFYNKSKERLLCKMLINGYITNKRIEHFCWYLEMNENWINSLIIKKVWPSRTNYQKKKEHSGESHIILINCEKLGWMTSILSPLVMSALRSNNFYLWFNLSLTALNVDLLQTIEKELEIRNRKKDFCWPTNQQQQMNCYCPSSCYLWMNCYKKIAFIG